MANPELLKMPFAQDGDKATIPETTDGSTGIFSQQYGFQSINSLPLQAGGKAVRREDFNGAFNMLSNIAFYAQKGFSFGWDATQSYFKGCVVIDPADDKRYECVADVAAGGDAPHLDTNNWRRYTLGDGVAVGIILPFAGNGAIPSGYLLCDGAAYSRTAFPDLFACIGTDYGSGDGSTTFNVPDANQAKRFLQGDTVAGTVKDAGLPNIEGTADFRGDTEAGSYGAFMGTYSTGAISGAMDGGQAVVRTMTTQSITSACDRMNFSAQDSNSIYGASTTVQPPALTTRYIIKAFDGQTADSALIDITQYEQELAHKAEINQSNMVHHRDVITTSGTYTAPATGLYKITVKGGGGGGANGAVSGNVDQSGGGGGEGGTTIAYEKLIAGDSVSVVIGAGGASGTSGASGGTTSADINNNTYTATGGTGGRNYVGGHGGDGTINGASGTQGLRHANTNAGARPSLQGGSGGGAGGGVCDTNKTTGVQGGGGAGGSIASATSGPGGAGGNGYVWFEYYTTGA